ncbi:hypothetical protein BDQ17DRAFT_1310651, partial [Cyathus striatus]
MSPLVQQLETPSPAQIEEITNVATRAFENDESIIMMTGGNKDLQRPLIKAMVHATALDGEIHIVSADNRIVSYCFWFPPGKDLFETEEQRALGYNDFFNKLSPEAQDWWTNKYIQTVGKFIEDILKPRHYKESWYAYFIATELEYRRQGNATALLKHVMEKLAKKGEFLALCAGVKENSDFYQKVGFELRGVTQLKGPTGDEEIPVYFL